MIELIVILLSALTALYMVNWGYFKILRIAKTKHLVDEPDVRKLQKSPIPVLGGIAVFLGVVSGILMASALVNFIPDTEPSSYMLPVLAGMVIMMYVGAMDDTVGIKPKSRIVLEALTILGIIFSTGECIDSLHGLWGIENFSWWIAVPLTVFSGVGIINAVNMIDGVNGLSSGLCMVCLLFFGVIFFLCGDISNALLSFISMASLLPFYVHNVFGLNSRMFIGDAGTMIMGVLMAWFIICVLRNDSEVASVYVPSGMGLVAMVVAILSVPVADTLRVMTMRVVHGKSPFSADKTHLHHVFVAAGFSHFFTSLSIIVIDFIVAMIWFISFLLGASADVQLYVVIAASVLFIWGTYGIIRYNELHQTRFIITVSRFSVKTHLGRTDWWKAITKRLDAPEDKYRANDDSQSNTSV